MIFSNPVFWELLKSPITEVRRSFYVLLKSIASIPSLSDFCLHYRSQWTSLFLIRAFFHETDVRNMQYAWGAFLSLLKLLTNTHLESIMESLLPLMLQHLENQASTMLDSTYSNFMGFVHLISEKVKKKQPLF